MGNVAVLLKRQGHAVHGADTGVYPPMSDVLTDAGITVWEGYDPERLAALAPDCVVVGNVVTRGNPEAEWLLETRALPFVSLAELIGRDLIGTRPGVVITGTHGKTTTAAMTAWLLRERGARPGWLIGGVPKNLPGGAEVGATGAPFVIEGDEYDTAFFDKRSKFIHYRPRILVVNNVEFDHADIFRDLPDVLRTFAHVIRLVPQGGVILYNGDDTALDGLLPVPWCPCFRVGTGKGCDLRLSGFAEGPASASFTLRWRGAAWGKVQWRLPGLYNARNAAMAALAAGFAVKPDDPLCAMDPTVLRGFHGVKRRMEVLHDSEAVTVIEDFGHHPTALAGTLASLRARYPGREITACFEPRSHTSQRAGFQGRFADALAGADRVAIAPLHKPERIPADDRLDPVALAAQVTERGTPATSCPTHEALLERLVTMTRPGAAEAPQLVIFFTNGSFGGILPRLCATL